MARSTTLADALPVEQTRPMTVDTGVPLIAHWIDGKLIEGSSQRRGEVFDPASGRVAKHVAFASAEDVDLAVTAAHAAFDHAAEDVPGSGDLLGIFHPQRCSFKAQRLWRAPMRIQ